MKLSVIIVNYNVQHFLEQCLHSVYSSGKNIAMEVFVVDNNSVDGSVAMVKEKFPSVHLIENNKNYGFSFANNQAIKESTGEYVLLLNPDTLVEEDTFKKTLTFMNEHPEAGGLGVQMIDGKGNFLPESKRGLPTPFVAFCKIFGLSYLFPKSKMFGKYHLGFLDKNKIHTVDVLSGAFMLLRKSTLDATGLLDDTFFMYGEDIDLSYRIIKAGYKNYYYPETRIIHYKGESTKKSSVNYVFIFYNAMIIFAQKHFSQKNAKLFTFLIKTAIYLRAGAAVVAQFIKKTFIPLIDFAFILLGMYLIIEYYEELVKYKQGGSFPQLFTQLIIPFYISVWLISNYFSGGYDTPVKISKVIRGVLVGTGIILIIYGLLPEYMRFSRALIFIGSVWTLSAMLTIRIVLHALKLNNFRIEGGNKKRIAIVGSEEEGKRVHELMKNVSVKIAHVCFVSPEKNTNSYFSGSIDQLKEITDVYKIDEVIFCAKDLSAQSIIDHMLELDSKTTDFKVAPPESLSIIGSNSIETSGELYTIDINSINKPNNIRNKRVLDIACSLLLLLLSPVLLFITRNFFQFIINILNVLAGKYSWVGYHKSQSETSISLPSIKPGILNPVDIYIGEKLTSDMDQKLNQIYAKDYRAWNDLSIILRSVKKLGRFVQPK